jgi:HAD superfamily hydrolase (TIGR01509 family)
MSSAAIFDLNGTLVDDMATHGVLWREVARKYGRDIPASMFIRDWAGQKFDEVMRHITERELDPEELRSVLAEREARYRALFPEQVREVAGCSAFLAELRAARVPTAVATSAPIEPRTFAMRALGIESAFDAVVGAESVTRGKPFPDIFLAAATALAVAPEGCIVFEDAAGGIAAARAAGMRAVGIATVLTSDELLAAGATWAATDYLHLPADLRGILGLR